MQNKSGINDTVMDKLILDIYSYAEKIVKTLNQISDVVDKTETFYKSDAAIEYRKKYNLFRSNISTIGKNVMCYADDLTKVKNRYEIIDSDTAHQVNIASANMQDVLK